MQRIVFTGQPTALQRPHRSARPDGLTLWVGSRLRSVLRSLGLAVLAVAFEAFAAGTCADFLHALAERESSMNASAQNQYGYVGYFQMGEAALIDAGYYKADGTGANDWKGPWTGKDGINSLADFKANPQAQINAVTAYEAKQWAYIQNLGLDKYIGQTIGGVEITRSGLIAGAHLVGVGNLGKFIWSKGTEVPVDGNKVAISKYISQFGGYELTGAGNNCSAMLTGTPTGGVPIAAPGAGVPPPVFYPASPTDGMTPDNAFYSTTGVSFGQLSMLIRLIGSTILLLIVANALMGNWSSFTRGRMSWGGFQINNKRLMVVVVLLILVFQ